MKTSTLHAIGCLLAGIIFIGLAALTLDISPLMSLITGINGGICLGLGVSK